MTRFLAATTLAIAAWMAAFITAGIHDGLAAVVATVAAIIAHSSAIATGHLFEQNNPTKETP